MAMTNDPEVSDRAPVVLLVDDQPHSVAALHDALDEAGYTVLVALDGESALRCAVDAQPDAVLLDAVMPGLDGYAVARRLQADRRTEGIPIIFMTGLSEVGALEAAFAAGGVDYVIKPVRPREVMVRLNTHCRLGWQRRAQLQWQGQARQALDAFGLATLVVRLPAGVVTWQTPLARELLLRHGLDAGIGAALPGPVLAWLRRVVGSGESDVPPPLVVGEGAQRLLWRVHRRIDDEDAPPTTQWLLVLEERSTALAVQRLQQTFGLTAREAEVLYWVAQGKINRDVADILGASPATVKKHLERILAKLGVETRTAAAALALQRLHTG